MPFIRVQLPWFLMKNTLIINLNVFFSWRDTRVALNIYSGISSLMAHPFSTSVGTSPRTTSTILSNHTKLANKKKEKNPTIDKVILDTEVSKVYKKGFPAYYKNFAELRELIMKQNDNKAGIYMFTNRITKKNYIGKSSDLKSRFINYYSERFLEINKGGSLIYRQLLKFGFENFSLTILEYCPSDDLLSREQYFINVFKPLLNIKKEVAAEGPIKPKVNKKNSYPYDVTSKDEIMDYLHRINKDLAEFKNNISIPSRVKELMDLAESTHNPKG